MLNYLKINSNISIGDQRFSKFTLGLENRYKTFNIFNPFIRGCTYSCIKEIRGNRSIYIEELAHHSFEILREVATWWFSNYIRCLSDLLHFTTFFWPEESHNNCRSSILYTNLIHSKNMKIIVKIDHHLLAFATILRIMVKIFMI